MGTIVGDVVFLTESVDVTWVNRVDTFWERAIIWASVFLAMKTRPVLEFVTLPRVRFRVRPILEFEE